jgi:saccharopine dehydrogenase (NAD+, L-lysine-forming)
VIGALGRSGRGACDALSASGVPVTRWDVAETGDLDRQDLLGHDLLVNTVLATTPVPAFVRPADVSDGARRLSVISDVSCDVTSDCNVLPIYDAVSTWQEPVRRLSAVPPLDLIAIDNLPSLLPREASVDFSAELAPHLPALADPAGVWNCCLASFTKAVQGA